MVQPRFCWVIYYFDTPTLERRHLLFGRVNALVPFPLPKVSCMLLFFPPSQRELNNSAACGQQHALLFPFPKKNLTKPQLHVTSLGEREKGDGEGRLNNWNHGKRGSPGPAGNSQQRKKSRKPRLEGRTIAPRPSQKLSKKHEVRPISFSWLAFTPSFRQKGKGRKLKNGRGGVLAP